MALSLIQSLRPHHSWMTTTAGNGPLPSGWATNALMSSSPDLMVISELLHLAEGRHRDHQQGADTCDHLLLHGILHGCDNIDARTTRRIVGAVLQRGKVRDELPFRPAN